MAYCNNCEKKLNEQSKFCDECGTEIVVTEKQDIKVEEKTFEDQIQRKKVGLWKKSSLYIKFSTIAITVFALLCLAAFGTDKTLSAIVAIVALALVIIALLLKKEIIKTRKRWLHLIALILAVALIVPCFGTLINNHPNADNNSDTPADTSSSDGKKNEDENEKDTAPDYKIDYSDSKSFEKALNDGVKVNGKVVQFDVVEYKPDSSLGINCWSGEHLNFISEEELAVTKGNVIIGRITSEPTKTLGSWEIHYEVLSISEAKTKNETTKPSATQSTEITITMGEDDFKGMNHKEAEKIFRKMGFTKFKYKTVDTEDESSKDTICYIEITEFAVGDSDFSKGDKFDSDATITFYSYKYKAPETPSPVFYSTNDYETAKKGNSGVFSYKNKSGSYDVYWIIDFDEGYVYWFTEGNGEFTCDKVKIESGDLNDKIIVTWHDGGEQWSWKLHFKYVNHPETLVVNDHNGFDTEFTTADLNDALAIRNTKNIKDY